MSEGQAASNDPGKPQRVWRGPDRRKRATPRFSLYSIWGGRRRDLRRADERDGTFVDVYSTRMWLIVMWVVLMNIADSFFTLVHLQNGGVEANPLAQALLATGREGFVFWKCGLIGLALVVLTIHKNFPMARLGLWVSAGAYTLLLCYHVALFFC